MNDIGRDFPQQARNFKSGARIVNAGLLDAAVRRQIDNDTLVASGLQTFVDVYEV